MFFIMTVGSGLIRLDLFHSFDVAQMEDRSGEYGIFGHTVRPENQMPHQPAVFNSYLLRGGFKDEGEACRRLLEVVQDCTKVVGSLADFTG